MIDVDVVINPIDCNASGTQIPGSIELDVEGGAGFYTYLWSEGSTTPNLTNITITGVYAVTVTDANGCTAVADNLIVPDNCNACVPPTVENIVVVEANCGEDNGTVTVSLVEDEALYTFTWSNGSTGTFQSGLTSDVYMVTITEIANPSCFIVTNVTVGNANGPEVTYTATPATCDLADGSASITPNTYDYAWPTGQTTASVTGLTAGTYAVTVTNPAIVDCPNIIEVVIEEENPLEILMITTISPTCGEANGSAEVTPTGGSNDYTYCLLYTSPSPRDGLLSRMPSSA